MITWNLARLRLVEIILMNNLEDRVKDEENHGVNHLGDLSDYQLDYQLLRDRTPRVSRANPKYASYAYVIYIALVDVDQIVHFERNSYKEVFRCKESEKWLADMNDEMKSLKIIRPGSWLKDLRITT